jgi:hypothetical protein
MIEIKHKRMAVVLGYDTEVVEGKSISLQASNSEEGGELEEKKEVENSGEVTIFYPFDYHGSSEILIRGSKSGEDSGTITV